MTLEELEHRKRHAIEKYKRKVGRESAGFMWNRFSPEFNFSIPTFAFNFQILINLEIDFNIIYPPITKAKYGEASYDVDVYDPLAPLGVLIPNELEKQLYLYLVRHFTNPNFRGYKYSMRISKQMLYASTPILEEFAHEKVWLVRLRKIEAWRLWGSYFDIAFFDCNIFSADEIFIRITDKPEDYGYPISERTTRTDNLSSNLYDHAVWDRAFYPRTQAPYKEIILLSPNLYCYQPVFDVANWDYDVFLDEVIIDPNAVYDIIEHFKERQNPIYQQLTWFRHSDRMKTMYAIHATYQHDIINKILRAFKNEISTPNQISLLTAFAFEYPYQRKFMQLVEGEKVVQKYVRLGLEEGLLRRIVAMTSRKH